ncbi:MAG: hypothetical protein ACK5NY_02035 [Burkholderiaceae bacterium]|jgi:hypothetical protein
MHIRQFQVGYAPEHDRILVRISSSEKQEVRCWLTRRMVKMLLPNLSDMMQKLLTSDRILSPAARSAILAMNREVAIYSADLATRYDDNFDSLPLGAEPLLVTQIELHPLGENGAPDIILRLFTASGQGFELRMAEQLQHGLYNLIARACDQAEWEIDASIIQTESASVQH